MNGAHSLVHTLVAGGVDVCFANPGTSEMHFVAALDQVPGVRCVLGLQENVVTGMADGYGRFAGKPAATLLHCGPGLANGLANLHNARRARTGIVNIVGDHATHHAQFDAPLQADTDALARSVSTWTRTSRRSADVGRDAAEAIAMASRLSGGVATLILPSDASWDEGGVPGAPLPVPAPPVVDPLAVESAARALRAHGPETLILLGASGTHELALALAWRVAAATGASLLGEVSCARVARGRGRVQLERVPYPVPAAIKRLAPYKQIVLVGAKPPVGFFAYPGQPSLMARPDAAFHQIARPDQDAAEALAALCAALKAPDVAIPDPGPRPSVVRGAPTPEGLAATLAAVMPHNSIVADESVSYGRGFYPASFAAPPHDWIHLMGGAIGGGMPMATGAAIGGGGRRVIGLQADGSAMYTLQSLWTQAREKLPVTTIILSNRRYQILIGEYYNVGAQPGPTAMQMLDLTNPTLGWVDMARGMGVEAAQATTLEGCADLMQASFASDAPFLIELLI